MLSFKKDLRLNTFYYMKKILFVSRPIAPPWDEASKNFAYNLSRETALLDGESEIHIMTKGNLENMPKNVVCENIYTKSEKDFSTDQKIRSLLFQLRKRNSFDIVQYFFTPARASSAMIKTVLKGKSKKIQTIATLREDLRSDEEIKSLMFGDVITTYSEYAKNKLNSLGFTNVVKIYPGIDLEDYSPREKDKKLLSEYGFKKDDFIISFAGEYIRLGAMDTVMDGFIEVAKKVPTAKLSLAVRVKNEKDAKKKEEVIERLKKENLLEKVSFHDNWRGKMSDLYNLCDVSIFPIQNMHGKFDVPLVLVEAMACEKPVIISNIPILKEFSDSNNSIEVEKENPKQLAEKIIDLYNNPEKAKELGKRARKFAEENFDIKKSAEKYYEIYKSL